MGKIKSAQLDSSTREGEVYAVQTGGYLVDTRRIFIEKIATYDKVKSTRIMIQVEASSPSSQLKVRDLSDQ